MTKLKAPAIPAVLRERKRFKQRIKNSGLLQIAPHDDVEAFPVGSEDMQRSDQRARDDLDLPKPMRGAILLLGESRDHAVIPSETNSAEALVKVDVRAATANSAERQDVGARCRVTPPPLESPVGTDQVEADGG